MKKISRLVNFFTALGLVIGMLAAIPARPVYAAALTVNTLADESDNSCVDGDCSLRDAVKVAVSGDIIDFSVTGTIQLTLGDIAIGKDLTISGPGSSQLTIDANDLSRHFEVSDGMTVAISGMTLTNGRVTQYHGGAIQNSGMLMLNDMVLTNNEVLATTPASYVNGGAIANWGDLTVTNSTISNNSAWYLGGGIYSYFGTTLTLTDVTLMDNIATGNPYPGGGGLFIASDSGTVSTAALNNVTITDNTSMYYGGGIMIQDYANVTIQNGNISGNIASGNTGGGIWASIGTSLVITNTSIQANSSLKDGGGIIGISLQLLDINKSNISGNTTLDDTSSGGDGAGLFITNSNTIIRNSTISNNSGAYSGGGIYLYNGIASLNNVTIAGNSANYTGGLYLRNTLTIKNSILADNISLLSANEDCLLSGGTLISEGYNLVEVTTGGCPFPGTGDITGQDAVLGSLANNGGDTQTVALGTGSPAIDAGNNATCESADQRGMPRPLGGGCDMGAFERQAGIDVTINVDFMGNYDLSPTSTTMHTYADTLAGPVKIVNTGGEDIFATQVTTSGGSYNELAGYPVNQFTTEYWFPYYDHGFPNVAGSNMRTWVLVGNPSVSQTAEAEIYINGTLKGSYSIAPGTNVTPRWIGLQGGPVRVVSTNGVNIFASERVFTVPSNSFNEVMGYPASQFTTEYWFPWYDTVYMDTYLLVGNTSDSQTAEVDIYIGENLMGSYDIDPLNTLQQKYPDTVAGPVRIVSTNGIDIITSEYTLSGTENSFNEVMGYPFDQFTTEYWFPFYDHGYPNVGGSMMRTWILIGNPSDNQTANVEVYIGGVLKGNYAIAPGAKMTPRWIGLQGGPVQVVSDIPIFTSERVFTAPTNAFNEFMGIPASQFTAEYWFPWYDNVYMNTKVLISKP